MGLAMYVAAVLLLLAVVLRERRAPRYWKGRQGTNATRRGGQASACGTSARGAGRINSLSEQESSRHANHPASSGRPDA